jgi:hypothetical protein
MSALPAGFAALEPYLSGWALESSAARAARRGDSTPAERQAFYDAIVPLLPAALDLLDAKPFAAHDAAEQNLMNLCLAAAHVALAVEALGEDEAKHAVHRAAMAITRTPADA